MQEQNQPTELSQALEVVGMALDKVVTDGPTRRLIDKSYQVVASSARTSHSEGGKSITVTKSVRKRPSTAGEAIKAAQQG